jgi:hypothetical protein
MSKSYSKSLSKSSPKSLAEKIKWGFCIIASIAILALLIYIITKDDNKTGGPNMAAPNVLSAAETDKICTGYKGCIIPYDKTRDLDCDKGELVCKPGLTDTCGGPTKPCVPACGDGFTQKCLDGGEQQCTCEGGLECGGKCMKPKCSTDPDKGLTDQCIDGELQCVCLDNIKTKVTCSEDKTEKCLAIDPKCGDKSAVYNCALGCCKCQDPNPVFNYTKNKCQA